METLYYDILDNARVRCRMCHHHCIVDTGKKGICRVRENQAGRLVSLVYSKIIARSIDPVEKKPIFHLLPGSSSYSIATMGCNFKCSFCQNAHISQISNQKRSQIHGGSILPENIVADALNNGCDSISYTYTEPTVFFELALDIARLAKAKGLYNIFVTNGFMTPELINVISPYLDAANVDLKAFDNRFYKKYCKAKLLPVLDNITAMKKKGVVVELTTLIIPGLNDDKNQVKKMAEFIVNEVGSETPWHISRFHPCHQMTDKSPTPVDVLEDACETGRKAGIRYVYTGNVVGSFENTYCHSCQTLLIRRVSYQIENYVTAKGCCPGCDARVYGIFK